MNVNENLLICCIINHLGQIVREIVPTKMIGSQKNIESIYELFPQKCYDKINILLKDAQNSTEPHLKTICINSNDQNSPIEIIVVNIQEGLLIIAGNSENRIEFSVFEELLSINNEHTNIIRDLNKQITELRGFKHSKNLNLYDQLTEINNELINTQRLLAQKKAELERSIKEIELLSKMIPICSSCKRIRDDNGFWDNVENYLSQRSEIVFSHSICPECMKNLYPDYVKKEK